MRGIVDIDSNVKLNVIGILVELDAVLGDDIAERRNIFIISRCLLYPFASMPNNVMLIPKVVPPPHTSGLGLIVRFCKNCLICIFRTTFQLKFQIISSDSFLIFKFKVWTIY